MEETDGKKLKRGPIRRPDSVPDWDRFVWDACVHEAGHVLMAMSCGVGVSEVHVPRLVHWSAKNLPRTAMAPGAGGPAVALANAAGNGAEWSRGGRAKTFSATDREGFRTAMGSDDRIVEFASAAADFFRDASIAAKLETMAAHLYERQGKTVNTSDFFGLVAFGREDMAVADSALTSLGFPYGRHGTKEEKERHEKWAADFMAAAAKNREKSGRPPR